MRAALPKAFAVEEHADETTNRPGQSEIAPYEFTQRVGVLRFGVTVVGGQRAGLRVATAIREFGRMQSRGARTEIKADPRGTVTIARRRDSFGESILLEAQLRQAVVAAIVVEEVGPHAKIVERRHRSDVSIDAGGLEIAGRESGALLAQGVAHRLHSRAEAVHDGNLADEERLHPSPRGFLFPGPVRAGRNEGNRLEAPRGQLPQQFG